jgi:hypothetical protein
VWFVPQKGNIHRFHWCSGDFLGRLQKGGNISSREMTLFELLETAEHPKFKQIAKLIK